MRLISLLALLCPVLVFAQPERLAFGDPPPELTMDVDTAQGAYIAYEWIDLTHEHKNNAGRGRVVIHRQIVVTGERGFEYADVQVPFSPTRSGGGRPTITAMVTQPDGTQIRLQGDDFLVRKENERFSNVVFAYPQVQVGSRLEMEVTYRFPNMSEPPNYTFVRDLPVQRCVVHLNAQKKYSYRAALRASRVEESGLVNGTVYAITPDPTRVNDPEFIEIGVNEEAFFVAENLAAERSLPYVRHRPNYESSVEFFTVGITKLLSSTDATTSWEKIGNMFQYLPMFGGKVIARGQKQIGKYAKKFTPTGESDYERAVSIYRWLTERVTWNDRYSLYSYPAAKNLLRDKRGNSGDLALAFTALLRHFDFDADAVLVRASEAGLNYRAFPELAQFSSVLVRTELDGETVYFDPTATNLRPGLVSPRLLAAEVFEPVRGRWHDLEMPLTLSDVTVEARIEDGELIADWTGVHDNYHAGSRRARLTDESESDPLESYRNRYFKKYIDADDELEELTIGGTENPDSAIVERMTIHSTDLAEEAGDLLYVTPLLRETFTDNPLSEPERNIPLESAYGSAFRFAMNLEIPEGYTVESLPRPLDLALDNDDVRARYSVAETSDGGLTITYELFQNARSIPAARYPEIRQFFEDLMVKQREVIVLRRAEN